MIRAYHAAQILHHQEIRDPEINIGCAAAFTNTGKIQRATVPKEYTRTVLAKAMDQGRMQGPSEKPRQYQDQLPNPDSEGNNTAVQTDISRRHLQSQPSMLDHAILIGLRTSNRGACKGRGIKRTSLDQALTATSCDPPLSQRHRQKDEASEPANICPQHFGSFTTANAPSRLSGWPHEL